MSAGDPGASEAPQEAGPSREGAAQRAERHHLHPLELMAVSWRTAKMEPARVIVPGLIIFGLDAIQGTFYTELAVDHLGVGSIIGAVLFASSALGLTFYAGMLERLVGSVERNEAAQPILQVLRTLPWGRLLLAEVILVLFSAVASVLLVVPGLIVGTLFALVGPLINLLDSSVPDAFRRSLQLVWPHFMLVFLFITLPLALEHEVVVFVAELIPHEHIWAIFLTTFILGDLFGMALGLMEVTMAERLVTGAQGPGEGILSAEVELRNPPRQSNPGRAVHCVIAEPANPRQPKSKYEVEVTKSKERSRSNEVEGTERSSEEAHHGRDDPRNDDAGARALARRRGVDRVRSRRILMDVRCRPNGHQHRRRHGRQGDHGRGQARRLRRFVHDDHLHRPGGPGLHRLRLEGAGPHSADRRGAGERVHGAPARLHGGHARY